MKIRKITLPQEALISRFLPADYLDAFSCEVPAAPGLTPDAIMIAFWTHSPKWVNRLFALRDLLVRPFGIKPGSTLSREKLADAIRASGSYGLMSVVTKSDSETIISLTDKHLKLYFSIKTSPMADGEQTLVFSSVVHFHNFLGRAYFYTIYPVHRLIVPGMIRHTLNSMTASVRG